MCPCLSDLNSIHERATHQLQSVPPDLGCVSLGHFLVQCKVQGAGWAVSCVMDPVTQHITYTAQYLLPVTPRDVT